MKLYHGTSEKHLPKILGEGIKPRGKGRGNWIHTVESNKDFVYLTVGYAIYFAGHSAKEDERLAVLEIDTARLNPFRLHPDEDFLEQATRKEGYGPAPTDKDMLYRTRWYRRRLSKFQSYWDKSVEGLGTCCYEGMIPPDAITRVATLDMETFHRLVFHGMDPTITTMNWKICEIKYRNYIHWLFGEPLQEDPMQPQRIGKENWELAFREEFERHQQILIDRAGVKVYTREEYMSQ